MWSNLNNPVSLIHSIQTKTLPPCGADFRVCPTQAGKPAPHQNKKPPQVSRRRFCKSVCSTNYRQHLSAGSFPASSRPSNRLLNSFSITVRNICPLPRFCQITIKPISTRRVGSKQIDLPGIARLVLYLTSNHAQPNRQTTRPLRTERPSVLQVPRRNDDGDAHPHQPEARGCSRG